MRIGHNQFCAPVKLDGEIVKTEKVREPIEVYGRNGMPLLNGEDTLNPTYAEYVGDAICTETQLGGPAMWGGETLHTEGTKVFTRLHEVYLAEWENCFDGKFSGLTFIRA